MNFWCFHPSVFDYTKRVFKEFLAENASNPKSEFFIPIVADQFIKDGEGVIKVIPTSAQWFGVTYKEDAPMVRESLMKLSEMPVNIPKTFGQNKKLPKQLFKYVDRLNDSIHFYHKHIIFDLFYLLCTIHSFQ